MTFFEHQARARQATSRLIVLFLLAVAGVTLAVNLVVATVYSNTVGRYPLPGFDHVGNLLITYASVPPALYVWTTLVTLGIIAIRSLVVIQRLRAGGDIVAIMAGGTPIDRGTRDPDARRLLNLVDEMAIASGVAVPRVYLLRGEPGVNALAAGYAPNQAAIAVTEGAMRRLTRDELQGVIGHEFSHVLNGDMRMNVQMIGALAGILFLGEIGEFLMRSSSSRNSRKSASGLVLVGLAITIIGYVGLFFGRLIRAGVSRQREYLADASSVQFTRNPDGLAGALATIGAIAEGSLVRNRHAETLSHMFFASGISVWFSSLFATHPPVAERIQRINPRFLAARYSAARERAERARAAAVESAAAARDALLAGAPSDAQTAVLAASSAASGAGAVDTAGAAARPTGVARPAPSKDMAVQRPAGVPPPTAPQAPRVSAPAHATAGGGAGATTGGAAAGARRWFGRGLRQPAPARASARATAVVASVGKPAPQHVEYAAKVLASIPAVVRETTTSGGGAHALVLAFALNPDDAARKLQLDLVSRSGLDAVAQRADRLVAPLGAMPPGYRLPALTLAMPSLRALPQPARDAIVRSLEAVVDADQRVTLEEFVLLTIVRHQLRAGAGRNEPIKYRSILEVLDDARLVVSLLAHAGGDDTQRAFERGFGVLGLDARVAVPLADIAFTRVAEALERLRRLAPFVKRNFVTACVETITADGQIALAEAELLRAVATALDCPVPPVLDALDPSAFA